MRIPILAVNHLFTDAVETALEYAHDKDAE
jgi:hypothetical protein